jgi:hypothetical protein
MNKLSTLINSALIILGTAFITLIVYVSILGDNHKIDFLVNSFFDDLKSHDYERLCSLLPKGEFGDMPCDDACFLLEISFLSRYNLMDKDDYAIEIKRDHFWFPFVTDDHVSVGIAFTEKKSNSFLQFFHHSDTDNFVKNFIQVKRSEGAWVITEISLEKSSIYPLFSQLKNEVVLDRYVGTAQKGYTLKENTVDPDDMPSLDRRLLIFNLEKLSDPDRKKDDR